MKSGYLKKKLLIVKICYTRSNFDKICRKFDVIYQKFDENFMMKLNQTVEKFTIYLKL